jgi:hypothetical protein
MLKKKEQEVKKKNTQLVATIKTSFAATPQYDWTLQTNRL